MLLALLVAARAWRHSVPTTRQRSTRQEQLGWLHQGLALVKQQHFDEAIRCYQQAFGADPDIAEVAHHNVASLLAWQGRHSEAVPMFEEALRINPRSVDVHVGLAQSLAALHRPEDAAGEYAEANRLDPQRAEARRRAGLQLIQADVVSGKSGN